MRAINQFSSQPSLSKFPSTDRSPVFNSMDLPEMPSKSRNGQESRTIVVKEKNLSSVKNYPIEDAEFRSGLRQSRQSNNSNSRPTSKKQNDDYRE